jgi:hypothetical protein
MSKRIIYLIVIILLLSIDLKAQRHVPPLNKKVIEYVNSVIGKQVDRGECWDLANQALIKIDAEWDKKYAYGKALNPKKDEIYPGDMIQFEGVKVEYQKDNMILKEEMKHHTAVVYKVLEPGVYQLAHQNTSFSGRKVGLSELRLDSVKKGKLKFYRPTKEKI